MLAHNSWGRNRLCIFSQKMSFLTVGRRSMPRESERITLTLEHLAFQFFIASPKFKYYHLISNQNYRMKINFELIYMIEKYDIIFFFSFLSSFDKRILIQISCKIKLTQVMNSKNDSLLGFLKKQTLFPNSPVRSHRKRSRSKSRDSRGYQQGSSYASSRIDSSQASRGLNRAYQEDFGGRSIDFIPKQNASFVEPNRYQYNIPEPKFSPKYNFEIKDFKDRASDQKLSTSGVNNNVWTDLMSHNGSFQSARIESSQCLSILTSKISNEISNINFKIQHLNNKIQKTITNELQQLQDKIKMIFDNAFRESERYMKEYMKEKERQLAGDLLKMREVLIKEQEKVDSMKNELTKPQWKKIAGQILSTDLENRIEELIKKSNYLQVKQWDLGDIGNFRIKNIQKQLKEIVRLKS